MQIKVNGVIHGEQKAYVGSSSAWKHAGWGCNFMGKVTGPLFGSSTRAGPLKETKNLIKDKWVVSTVLLRFILKYEGDVLQ